jgi:hypothetical protein
LRTLVASQTIPELQQRIDGGALVPFAIIDLEKKWYGEVCLSQAISGRSIVVRLNPARNAHGQSSIDVRCVAFCGFRTHDANTWNLKPRSRTTSSTTLPSTPSSSSTTTSLTASSPSAGSHQPISGRLPEPIPGNGNVGWWLGLPALQPVLPAISFTPSTGVTGLPPPYR